MPRTLCCCLVVATLLTAVSTADAAISSRWRRNAITPAAIAARPQLAGAVSVSLVVTLTGGSLFNGAALSFSAKDVEVNGFFNQSPFGSDAAPSPALFSLFPDLEFDTYVSTTDGQTPAIFGRLTGSGPALLGTTAGPFGPQEMNVAWAATPNTGPTGGVDLEIARVTYFATSFYTTEFTVPVSGYVYDSINPNTNIFVPPFPNFQVPEPNCCGLIAASLLMCRRLKRRA